MYETRDNNPNANILPKIIEMSRLWTIEMCEPGLEEVGVSNVTILLSKDGCTHTVIHASDLLISFGNSASRCLNDKTAFAVLRTLYFRFKHLRYFLKWKERF